MVSHLKWLFVLISFFALNSFAAEEQIKFLTKKIQLGKKSIQVEVADTEQQQAQGLMFRKKMDAESGMLFVFNDEQVRSFWMKNTLIDLSIGYFNKEKKLIDIQDMAATSSIMQQSLPTYISKSPAMYALEMNKGWFKKNKINLGSTFKFILTRP